jgi:DNA-binding winged helix-turn-helix (wHTH) protein
MHKPDHARYRFGNVELDIRGRRVRVAGQPCPLEPKSFELLKFLVANRGRAVGKEEIVAAVWPATFVTDNSLTRAVTKIRKALGDDSREPKYIETLPTIGYRFNADCAADDEDVTPTKNVTPEFVSIAVLPVANRTGDPDLEYLAEGLTDGGIRLLSGIPKLKVIARSTVYRFKIAGEDSLSFARSLGVNVVLTGELRRLDNRVVFDTELTDVDEGAIVVCRRYWPNLSDWMEIQADLALDVVRGLNLDLDRGRSARIGHHPNVSSEAYQILLRGEFLSRRLAPADLPHALAVYREVLRLDDQFARAWEGTAQMHVLPGSTSSHPPCTCRPRTRNRLTGGLDARMAK